MINRNSKYNKKRINESNIKEYLLEKFSGAKEINSIKRNVIELENLSYFKENLEWGRFFLSYNIKLHLFQKYQIKEN